MPRKGILHIVAFTLGALLTANVGSAPVITATTPGAPVFQPIQVPAVSTVPTQDAVSEYLRKEWKLASGYANKVSEAIYQAAERYNVDPLLLMAIAAAESSFNHIGNPNGKADPREPFGIMQIAGKYHAEKFPGGKVKATSVSENIFLGARILREYLDIEEGNERRALLRYNGTLNVSDRYYQRIRRMRNFLLGQLTIGSQGNV